jgi:TonB family protein
MTATPTTGNWNPTEANGRTSRAGEWGLSLLLGVGFTLALFVGIGWYQNATPRQPPAEFSDLAIAMLPVTPPPPPPTRQTEAEPEIVPLAGFELSPSASPVKVAATPPNLEPLRAEELSRAPTAKIELHLPVSFRPKVSLRTESQHIYQKFEVDKVATVLMESPPQVPRRLFEGESVLRLYLIWVVETDGTTSDIRIGRSSGKPEVDELIRAMVREMVFSPAMKGGRKVRQTVSQPITVKWSGGSVFQLQ